MSGFMSLAQTAMSAARSLQNAGDIIKSEIKMDEMANQDVSKKQKHLEDVEAKENKAYDYVSEAISVSSKGAQDMIDSLQKATDTANAADKTDKTDKVDKADKNNQDDKRDSKSVSDNKTANANGPVGSKIDITVSAVQTSNESNSNISNVNVVV